MTALLETHGLTVTFGGVRAVSELDLQIERGQLVGVIGPNGAGKTTAIDGITGFVPTSGRVVFDGREISSLPAHRRARAGLGRTWQSVELFDDLTIAENLMVAAEQASSWRDVVLDLAWPRRRRDHAAVERGLVALGIEGLGDRMPNEISQGQRKLVGVARALAGAPKLICMDEPAAGLDSVESIALGERLRHIVDTGVTILLVDHDMGLVLNTCDYIYVIEFGSLIAAGTAAEVSRDPHVIEAYLGASRTEERP
jgi:branched-chain amino acid transport system ATP-binding protein